MPIFGNAAQRTNFNNVLDQILRFSQQSSLQSDQQAGQMNYLGRQQQGYVDLENLKTRNEAVAARTKYGEAVKMEGIQHDFKTKEIRDSMIAALAPQSQIIQLGGLDLWNKTHDISDPETTLAFHKSVTDASVAWAKSVKGGDPLSAQETEDLLNIGPTLAKDITGIYIKSSQFKAEAPGKAIDVQSRATSAKASMLDAQTKAGAAGGKDEATILKAQGAVLKDISDSMDKVGTLPPGAGVWDQLMATFAKPTGKDALSPELAGTAREFVTRMQLQVASGRPLKDWQARIVFQLQNRAKINREGFPDIQATEGAPVQPGAVVPPPVVAAPPEIRMINGVPYKKGLGPNGEPGWIKVK